VRTCLLAAFLPCITLATVARANPNDIWGAGEQSMGRAGTGIVLDADGFSSWRNPARLGAVAGGELSLGGHGGGSWLRCPTGTTEDGACRRGIYWDQNDDGYLDASDPEDRWLPDAEGADRYEAPSGLRLGLARRLGRFFGVGLAIQAPARRLLLIEQQDPWVPWYPRWKNRHQRPSIHGGLAFTPKEGISVGVGLSVLAQARLTLDFAVEARVSDDALGQEGALATDFVVNPSYIEVDVRPAVSPVIGVSWDLGTLSPKLQGLRFGAVYRHPVELRVAPTLLALDFRGVVDDVGDFGDVLVPMQARVLFTILDFSTPRQVALALGFDRPRGAVTVEATWNHWSATVPNVALVDEDGTDVQIGLVDLLPRISNAREVESLSLRDTWTLRVGGELRPPEIALHGRLGERLRALQLAVRLGYAWDPSFLPEPTGRTNLLDSDDHQISFGFGLGADDPTRLLRAPWSVDLWGQVHVLPPRVTAKDPEWTQEPLPGMPVGGVIESGGVVAIVGGGLTLHWGREGT
jgi:long-subunit fatty acid transport protein